MKLNIPKLTRPMPLTDYAPELTHDDGSPAVVQVWVNPPQALLTRHAELRARGQAALKRVKEVGDDQAAAAEVVAEIGAVGAALAALFAELWSQHADPATHWTPADVLEVANSEANPALYGWLTGRTVALIGEYRSGLRKN